MAQIMRYLLNLKKLSTIITLPKRTCTFINNNNINSNTINKDLIKSSSSVQAPDLLMQNLKRATNTRYILDLVALHNKIMNNKHIMQALRSLFTLQKTGHTELTTKEILTHRNFSKLCYQLKTKAGIIDLNETIDALKIVSYVGVPSNSEIVEVLLQLIRHNINDLSLNQIIFLDFLFNQLKSTPIIEALKIALPLIFQIQLKIKMNVDDPIQLAEYLFYLSRNDSINFNCVDSIVNALMKYLNKFDGKTAKSIVWSICDMGNNDSYQILLKNCLHCLTINVDELSIIDLEATLTKLIKNYNYKYKFFYDETFFDSIANRIIDQDLGYKNSIYVLRKFTRIEHSNNYLLDYLVKKVIENPNLLDNSIDVYSIALALGLTEYRPVHWEQLKQIIETTEDIAISDRKEIIWLKFGASLCLLNIFKIDILNRCLKSEYLDKLFKKNYSSDIKNYLILWQSIKLNKPELSCLLSPKYLPEILIRKLFNEEINLPLTNSLEVALGGKNYLKSGLLSKFGVYIHHAVVFRKGGYPVAFQQNIEFIEDLEIPPEHHILIIQGLDENDYTLNKMQIKPSTLLSIKFMQNKGYEVVPICLQTWRNLADFEKIPFLMQAIKDKTKTDVTSISDIVI